MGENIIYTSCPSCNSTEIAKELVCRDYTVSGTPFEIWQCGRCTLRFTQNVPGINAIGRFYQSDSYVSHSDTKAGVINRVYHIIRKHTLKTKRSLVENVTGKSKGSLLDVGAGTGAFAYTMKNAGWSVTALEPDETARANARKNYNLDLDTPSTLQLIPPESIDSITLWHVLEHVHELHNYLSAFYNILKNDGRLIIAVPNYTSLDAGIYKEYWAAYDVPRHLYHFSPLSMETLVSAKGFTLEKMSPMWFDSFYVSMLSEKYKNGKGNVTRAFWNGFLSAIKTLGNRKHCSSIIYIMKKVS